MGKRSRKIPFNKKIVTAAEEVLKATRQKSVRLLFPHPQNEWSRRSNYITQSCFALSFAMKFTFKPGHFMQSAEDRIKFNATCDIRKMSVKREKKQLLKILEDHEVKYIILQGNCSVCKKANRDYACM